VIGFFTFFRSAFTETEKFINKKLVLFTGFFLCCCLSACALVTPPVEVSSSLPIKARIKNLAFYPQKTDQCGPESLATLLSAVGVNKKPEELSPYVFLPARGGSLAIDLVAQARQQGVLVYPLSSSIDDLLIEVAMGNPVLILQNLGFSWRPKWHFAVVIGYDLQRQQVILRSGPRPQYFMPLSLLDRTWSRANRWAITVMKPGDLPATLDLERYLQAAVDLETTGQTDAAYRVYLGASQRWQENNTVWFGLGNSAYALGRFDQAKLAFETLLNLDPANANAWNNLAYTYEKLNCPASARYSAECAVKMEPQNPQFLDTYDDIHQGKTMSKTKPTSQVTQCSRLACPF
jgi:tetratricopeptide (TPR) repeat protein